jgi:hypothetical protein
MHTYPRKYAWVGMGHVGVWGIRAFYVRAAIEAKTGVRYTLKHVENAMKHEGMLDDV